MKKLVCLSLAFLLLFGVLPAGASAYWEKDESDGEWHYYEDDGTPYTGWLDDEGTWRYFMNGSMLRSEPYWDNDDMCQYGFNAGGALIQNGWLHYQFDYVDVNNKPAKADEWYYFGPDGRGVDGWIQDGADRYYCASGHVILDGVAMDVDEDTGDFTCYGFKNGEMIRNGWYGQEVITEHGYDTEWYYFGPDGTGVNGWQWMDNRWYYFSNGFMASGGIWYVPEDDCNYCFSAGGRVLCNAWYHNVNESYMSEEDYENGTPTVVDEWLYFGYNGKPVSGWQKIDGDWYFFDDSNAAVVNGWAWDGGWCWMDGSGIAVVNAYADTDEGRFWFGPDGHPGTPPA